MLDKCNMHDLFDEFSLSSCIQPFTSCYDHFVTETSKMDRDVKMWC